MATDTITEDIHTTIRLHRRGWRTVYHNEVLARGLAAGDADTYQLQRLRWGTGAMQVLRGENPLLVPGLTLPQRLSYAATLLGWFDAWRTLGFAILPMVVVVTGVVPIRADLATFAFAFLVTFLLQQLALKALSRGCHRPDPVRRVRAGADDVEPAGDPEPRDAAPAGVRRHAQGPPGRRAPPRPGAAAAARPAARAPWSRRHGSRSPCWAGRPSATSSRGRSSRRSAGCCSTSPLVCLAIGRIRSLRYAPERRASVRFESVMPALVDGLVAEARDVSTTGARVVIGTGLPVGSEVALEPHRGPGAGRASARSSAPSTTPRRGGHDPRPRVPARPARRRGRSWPSRSSAGSRRRASTGRRTPPGHRSDLVPVPA